MNHGSRIASVVHLAAYFDFTGEDNPLYQSVNVDGPWCPRWRSGWRTGTDILMSCRSSMQAALGPFKLAL